MNISDAGLNLIKSFEALRLKAYKPTPDDVWTIGYGHTKNVGDGDTCTDGQALNWLREDLGWVESCINKNVKIPLVQNEFDALCSLVFNIGCTAFAGSTLLKLLNNADYDGASAQFGRWNKQEGKELATLTRRREAERELFA